MKILLDARWYQLLQLPGLQTDLSISFLHCSKNLFVADSLTATTFALRRHFSRRTFTIIWHWHSIMKIIELKVVLVNDFDYEIC